MLDKLDLGEFIAVFQSYFSREKSYALQGDRNLVFRAIEELKGLDFIPPSRIKNLDRELMSLRKFGILSILEIFEFIKIIRYFLYLKSHEQICMCETLARILEKINIPAELINLEMIFKEKGEIKSGVFKELDAIKLSLSRCEQDIRERLRSLFYEKRLQNFLVDSQIHFFNERECLLLRPGFENVLKGVIIGRSQSGFFYFLPESIQHLYSKSRDLKNLLEIETLKICRSLSLKLSKMICVLEFMDHQFDVFDHIQARVRFALDKNLEFIFPATEPKLRKKNTPLILSGFIHPILMSSKIQPKELNLEFNAQLLLISGVNAGGKTVVLKSILSACFLSKHLIPFKIHASKSYIPDFKDIQIIISDPQDSNNNISTFAGRMMHFSSLLHKRDFLLGVDEIELGTDSTEAATLYKVLLEELLDRGARIVVTTHHKHLASLMAKDSRVELLAALYDEDRECPRFEFLKGSIGKSFAFETAMRYKIPSRLIHRMQEEYNGDMQNLNDLIEKSSTLEMELRQRIAEVKAKEEELEKKKQLLNQERERANHDFLAQKQKLESIFQSALREFKSSVKTLPQMHKSIARANEILAQAKALKVKAAKSENNKHLRVGDRVKFGNHRGVILDLIKQKDGLKCLIEVESGMRFRVESSRVSIIKSSPPLSTIKPSLPTPKEAYVHLDLHGLRVEEALERLDKFLSDSIICGFDEVVVYHGIGTGALSRAVAEFLKNHPKILGFEDAPPRMGGFGAKIIHL